MEFSDIGFAANNSPQLLETGVGCLRDRNSALAIFRQYPASKVQLLDAVASPTVCKLDASRRFASRRNSVAIMLASALGRIARTIPAWIVVVRSRSTHVYRYAYRGGELRQHAMNFPGRLSWPLEQALDMHEIMSSISSRGGRRVDLQEGIEGPAGQVAQDFVVPHPGAVLPAAKTNAHVKQRFFTDDQYSINAARGRWRPGRIWNSRLMAFEADDCWNAETLRDHSP
jgi:hypothetical protein